MDTQKPFLSTQTTFKQLLQSMSHSVFQFPLRVFGRCPFQDSDCSEEFIGGLDMAEIPRQWSAGIEEMRAPAAEASLPAAC